MDPLGFGLENFNAVGQWRIRDDAREAIDSTGVLPDGTKFSGPEELKQVLLSRKDQFAPTRVGRGASIGANATIVCGVTIGAYALIGAGAVVARDVAPHAIVVGVPAVWAGWACRCGERLPQPDPSQRLTCAACGDSYRAAGAGVERLVP